MNKRGFIVLLSVASLTLVAILVSVTVWLYRLNDEVVERLKGRRFLPPTEFYSAPEKFFRNQKLKPKQIESALVRLGYTQSSSLTTLAAGQFTRLPVEECQAYVRDGLGDITQSCLVFRSKPSKPKLDPQAPLSNILVAVGPDEVIIDITKLETDGPQSLDTLELEPELFAQFYGDKPLLRTIVQLGDTPPQCLNALLAIEDSNFLEHGGVSVTGLLRAFLKNLAAGRLRQGGSTITQQLVKNYFLTSERTLSRKVKELFMALMLEAHATKDDILETYINEIYMGQNGPFEVRGFGAASEHYFSQPLSELNLHQCALLAAIVNSPGRFNPFLHPKEATERRTKVIDRMAELKLISAEERNQALQASLPPKPIRALTEPAPFFVETVRNEIQKMSLDLSEGAKIYTTLNLAAQEAARTTVQRGLEALEKNNKRIKELLGKGKRLEAALISADPISGEVQAVIGGRQFKVSQFNRALNSQRQIGSLMKPLVYLTALQNNDEEGRPFSPVTLISDDPYTYKYDKQVWSPKNYDRKNYGNVPLFFALKSSLNAATSRLAVQVGMEKTVETAKQLGITSKLKALPSLALGAFEMTPLEVLRVYSTFAGLGTARPLTFIRSIQSLDGQTMFEADVQAQEVVSKGSTAVLVGMMKQTIASGTGRSIRTMGFNHPAAGKTGTTNDTKDAWFAGFTPLHVAVVWVGFDDSSAHGLTGTSGAVPIWTDYMKQVGVQYPPVDFPWPEEVVVGELDVSTQESLGVPTIPQQTLEPAEMVFIKGTQPSMLIMDSSPSD
jgi:penicillin-binding protein 1B